jgi:hypothetical protein
MIRSVGRSIAAPAFVAGPIHSAMPYSRYRLSARLAILLIVWSGFSETP